MRPERPAWPVAQRVGVDSREKALAVEKDLRALEIIDVSDFIIGDSDVDIVARERLPLEASAYGVSKIDYILDGRFDPKLEKLCRTHLETAIGQATRRMCRRALVTSRPSTIREGSDARSRVSGARSLSNHPTQ